MNLTITEREKYISHCDVRNYLSLGTNKIERTIFGKKVILSDDPWLWHLHIKFCECCNAKCDFCIEQESCRKENPLFVIYRVDKMLKEQKKAGILNSVSVTGGEPTIMLNFPFLCDVLYRHRENIKFLTLNTNGSNIDIIPAMDLQSVFDFINVSRHSIDDEENRRIFRTNKVPDLKHLRAYKELWCYETKMRIQCVMQKPMSVDEFLKMLEVYRFADNVSFRRLMNPPSNKFDAYHETYENSYFDILDYVSKNGKFIEQTIQDYYVYEIWEINGVNVTFSYSDMDALSNVENEEDDSIIREFIIHPDGVISGSWNDGKKVILDASE
jgi:MoaA/NifB/PqqE/SkfB family radical SAM enzyme